MLHEKTAATLVVGDVLSNNGAVIDQVVLCGHGRSVYIRAKFEDGYTQTVTIPAETMIFTWTPDEVEEEDSMDPVREALANLRMAESHVQLVYDGGMGTNDELGAALCDIAQAIRFLTGAEVPS